MARPTEFSNEFSSEFGGDWNHGTLFIKIGTNGVDPDWQDGDIVDAYSRLECRRKWADMLCHVRLPSGKLAAIGGNGLIPVSDPLYDFYSNVARYKFERISANQLKQIRLSDLAEVTFHTGVTQVDLQGRSGQMDVAAVVSWKLRTQNLNNASGVPVFGLPGSEIWFEGRTLDIARIDLLWEAIEPKLSVSEADYIGYPVGSEELKTMLVIRTNDFSLAEKESFKEQEFDATDPQNPIFLRQRRRNVAWQSLDGLTGQLIADIQNPNVSVDIRPPRKHVHQSIVNLKA